MLARFSWLYAGVKSQISFFSLFLGSSIWHVNFHFDAASTFLISSLFQKETTLDSVPWIAATQGKEELQRTLAVLKNLRLHHHRPSFPPKGDRYHRSRSLLNLLLVRFLLEASLHRNKEVSVKYFVLLKKKRKSNDKCERHREWAQYEAATMTQGKLKKQRVNASRDKTRENRNVPSTGKSSNSSSSSRIAGFLCWGCCVVSFWFWFCCVEFDMFEDTMCEVTEQWMDNSDVDLTTEPVALP